MSFVSMKAQSALASCLVLTVAAAGLSACSGNGSTEVESGDYGQRYFVLGDQFRRVAAWCDGPNMIYQAEYREPALAVIADDPRCRP